MPLLGAYTFAKKIYGGNLELGGIQAMPEEFIVDPSLPSLAQDPRFPQDLIVVPRGRLIAVKPGDVTTQGKTILTIADGTNNKPAGFAPFNYFRTWPERIQDLPTIVKQRIIQVPYITAINDAYSGGGRLMSGDKITAYSGSVSAIAGAPEHKGKIVKWVGKSVYTTTAASAVTSGFALSSAVLPAFTPKVIAAFDASGALYTGTAATLAFNSTGTTCWKATFASDVKTVIYEYGQGPEQIAGEVIRLEPLEDVRGWLQWVKDNFTAWEVAPLLYPRPYTSVTDETASVVDSSNNQFKLANVHLIPNLAITVTIVSGTLVNPDGTTTTLDNTQLALYDSSVWAFRDYTRGLYYAVNPVTGELQLDSNITVDTPATDVKVSYSYEHDYREGKLWDPGVQGITDGVNTGVRGVPNELDVAGCTGALRAIIY